MENSTIGLILGLILLVYYYFKYSFNYWKRIGLPSMEPTIPFGNASEYFTYKKSLGQQFKQFYDYFKLKRLPHGGVYFIKSPYYTPVDPETIKNIMQKDFSYFMNHGLYSDEENDPLSGHLFNLENAKWKDMRIKLTPTFTSGKMKMMFDTLLSCTEGLKTMLDNTAEMKESVEIKEVLARFTTDIIGSCAFGLDCKSMENSDNHFRKHGKLVFYVDIKETIKLFMQLTLPFTFLRLIKFKITKPEVEKYFLDIVKKTVDYREKNNVTRKDFLQLLIELKNHGNINDDEKKKVTSNSNNNENNNNTSGLTMNELTAQAFVFFIAGFETTSTTMSFALFELAQNQDIQQKLRQEINDVLAKHNNKLTYDAINEMNYLDKVVQESLRKHPPVSLLFRSCNKNYTIPNTNICIEKGVRIGISVLGLHYDPEYYPDPEKFDPERFSEEAKSKRPAFTWLPFGEGPRHCIGLRFGMLQSKVGLATIIRNFKVTLSPKTKVPLELDTKAFITSVKSGIWVNIEKIN